MTIASARDLLGWSQTKLAAEAGQHVSTVNDLERGRNKRPSYLVVMRIVGALRRGGLQGLTPEDIFPVDKAKAS